MDLVIDTAVKYNDIFMSGAKITIIISLLSCFFGLLLGIILAFMKISGIKILQAIATVYVEIYQRYASTRTDFARVLRASIPWNPFPEFPDLRR